MNERMMVPRQQTGKQQVSKPQIERADIVIIGNGIAGLTAAIEARRLAPDKEIAIITEQMHPTINTPALKQFAIGKLEREQLLAYPAGIERAERIHVVSAYVEEIHAGSKYLKMKDGIGFGYDKLLIATGSAPSGLSKSLPGRNFDGVRTLHRLQDFLDLRRRLGEVSDAIVIGGGVHAIETVMGLLYWNIRVHWLIRGNTFMARTLDEPASAIVLERVQKSGGKVYTNTEIMGIVGRVGAVAGVITNQQEMIPCQLVLTCTGTYPITTLTEHCTLPIRQKNGIIVDDQLRTTAPDIYAAGDVAALKNPLTGAYETRALWYAAVAQGRVAGAAMTGHAELSSQPFGVQWHATHLGELSMLTVGSPLSMGANTMTLTDTSQGGYRRLAIVDDRLVGYLALGSSQPDSLAIKRIIDEGHSVRDITKALLKGDFDARQYLSQQHSRAAQGMLTGQLPPLALPAPKPARVNLTYSSGRLPAAQAQRHTDALTSAQPIRDTDELAAPVGYPISASSGIIPSVRQPQPVRPVPPQQQPEPLYIEEDEISPFTGTLPVITGKIVESSLTPIQSASTGPTKTPSRSLWAYSAKQPIVKPVNSSDSKEKPTTSARRPSHNLWSYSQQGATTPLERDR